MAQDIDRPGSGTATPLNQDCTQEEANSVLPEINPLSWSMPSFAIRRPVTIAMLVLALLALGAITWIQIPTEFIMPIDFPQIRCWIPYFGAAPQQVEAEIAIPAEGEFRTLKDLERVYTRSDSGGCYILLSFGWDTNMANAMSEVRDRVERLKIRLPEEVEHFVLRRSSSNTFPIMAFTLLSSGDSGELAQWTRTALRARLMRIPGVADVSISGQEAGTVHVDFDQVALRSANLSIYSVISQLRRDNFELSLGEIQDGVTACAVRISSQFQDLDRLRNVVVGPNALRLGQVADLRYQGADSGSSHTIDGKRGVFIDVMKEAEANTIATCKAVHAEIERSKKDAPFDDLDIFVFMDLSQNIMAAMTLLRTAGKNGALLALLVLFLFMRRIRPTLIVATSIPLSLVASLVGVYFMGMSLNTVTMASMIVCVGMLVDNSIVVMENIVRYQELGFTPKESARRGADEVGLAITAATLTTVVVFVPVFYMETNEMSIYMQEFSTPVAVAILSSLVVSLSIIPLAASALRWRPRYDHARTQSRVRRYTGDRGVAAFLGRVLLNVRPFHWTGTMHRLMLAWCIRRRVAALAVVCALVAVSYAIPFRRVGMQRLPSVDLRRVVVRAQFAPNNDWTRAESVFKAIEERLNTQRDVLDIQNIYVGGGTYGGEVRAYLVQLEDYPRGKRPPYSTDEVRQILAQQLAMPVPGGEVRVDAVDGGPVAQRSVSVRMRGQDAEILGQYAEEFKRRLGSLHDVIDVSSDTEDAGQEIQLQVEADRAAATGLNPYLIARTVDFALRGTRLFDMKLNAVEVPVEARLRAEDRRTVGNLDNISLLTTDGRLVPLENVVQKQKAPGPRAIHRENGKNVLRITAAATIEDMAKVKRDIESLIASFSLPLGYEIEVGEELEELETNYRSFGKALVLALILIYIVMAALFESYLLPLSILTSVPLAFIGVYWSMYITRTQMDAVALVGAILMCGVIVNNGIVIVDYINQLRIHGQDRHDAILNASRDRFRPVMMTALTTIVGCIPLALGTRLGEVAFHSLGRALIGGLTTGTLLTLFVVPLFYTLIDDLRIWFLHCFACLSATRATSR